MGDRVYSEEEFKGMAAEARPLLKQIAELTKKWGCVKFVDIMAWENGDVDVDGPGLAGWKIQAKADGRLTIQYKYESELKEA